MFPGLVIRKGHANKEKAWYSGSYGGACVANGGESSAHVQNIHYYLEDRWTLVHNVH